MTRPPSDTDTTAAAIWRRKSDEEVSAALKRLHEYTEEGQEIIKGEATRRSGSRESTSRLPPESASRSRRSGGGVVAWLFPPTIERAQSVIRTSSIAIYCVAAIITSVNISQAVSEDFQHGFWAPLLKGPVVFLLLTRWLQQTQFRLPALLLLAYAVIAVVLPMWMYLVTIVIAARATIAAVLLARMEHPR